MRRYDMITGILLILSIIDFALAAPVIGQEKRQASVDVVHIPKDVITVLGKRGPVGEGVVGLSQIDHEIQRMWKSYFDNFKSDSSGTHTPSGSEASDPPEPGHGTTNVVHAPAPNPDPVSSTANPDPGPSHDKSDDESNWPPYTPTSSGYSSDREFIEAHALQPTDPRPWPDSESDSESSMVDWDHLMILKDSPRPPPPPGQVAAGSSQELFAGQAQEYQVDPSHANSQPSTSGYAPSSLIVPEHGVPVVTPPSESVESPNLRSLSLSADSQPVDLQADTYAAKESRRSISGAARDHVGNVAQKESQPAVRSLDPGDL